MKKSFYLLFALAATSIQMLTAQVNIVVSPDSVYKEDYATEPEISLPSHITNNSGSTVTIRWTRVVEQEPQGWDHAFCDKNLCYFGTVSSKTFELIDGEEGLLKPIFYPNGIAGTGVMRVYLISETPGIMWADTAVYVAVATELVGSVEAELVRDVAIFPSPTSDVLNVVTADADLQGQWRITDAAAKVWCHSKIGTTPIAGQILITELPVGLYFLHVLTPDQRHATVKRFVVQR
ncbi:MAG: T9SS type A sorting domain-containing protein [Chitinophagales bacterium]|nr:T9SS type A sorting domain-containing protein [Chitinophagales bacterium]